LGFSRISDRRGGLGDGRFVHSLSCFCQVAIRVHRAVTSCSIHHSTVVEGAARCFFHQCSRRHHRDFAAAEMPAPWTAGTQATAAHPAFGISVWVRGSEDRPVRRSESRPPKGPAFYATPGVLDLRACTACPGAARDLHPDCGARLAGGPMAARVPISTTMPLGQGEFRDVVK
jgi:hypothetical protein